MTDLSPHIDYAAAISAWDDYCADQVIGLHAGYQCRVLATRFLHWLEPEGIGLADVTPQHVDGFLGVQDVTPTTKTYYRKLLRRFFDALVARGLMRSNPIATARPRYGEPPPRADEMNDAVGSEVHTGSTPLAELTAFFHDLGSIDERSEYFRPGLVAMYPIIVGGMDPHEIAAVTDIPLSEVELYIGRLRENGIWTSDGKVVVDFDDPQSADAIVNLAFIIGCAQGIFVRVPEPDDQGSDDQATAAEAATREGRVRPPSARPAVTDAEDNSRNSGWSEERRQRHSEQMKAYWQRKHAAAGLSKQEDNRP